MTAPVKALFEPFRLGNLELPTRVVMAPHDPLLLARRCAQQQSH